MLQKSLVETGGWARQVAHPIMWSVMTLLVAAILALAVALVGQANQHQPGTAPSPGPSIEHQTPGGPARFI
jgi:hypothetical protein